MDRRLAGLNAAAVALGIVILVLASSAVWSVAEPTQQTETANRAGAGRLQGQADHRAHAEAETQHRPDSDLSVEHRSGAGRGGNPQEGQDHDYGKLTDWLLIIFNALLAAFTFFLWKSTDKLWKSGERQIEIASNLANSAGNSAQAAVAQVLISRLAVESTERAFVVYDPFRERCVKNEDTGEIIKWTMQASWRNVGNTPTKHMVTNFSADHKIGPNPMGLDSFADNHPEDSRDVSLGPSRFVFSSAVDYDVELLQKIKRGEAESYFWGWADYNDVFEGTVRHRTEFCTRLVVHGDPTKEDCKFGHSRYGDFNGIDSECSQKPKPY